MGIMSYVSSPLWLLLLIVSGAEMMSYRPRAGCHVCRPPAVAAAYVSHAAELGHTGAGHPGAAVWSQAAGGRRGAGRRRATRAHGGTRALVTGAFWEALFSTLMAPIVMLQHSWYVLSILMGMATGWNAQTRTDRALPLGLVGAKFAAHTLIGMVAAFVLWSYVPTVSTGSCHCWPDCCCRFRWWCSVQPAAGPVAREDRLFLVPSETRGLRSWTAPMPWRPS